MRRGLVGLLSVVLLAAGTAGVEARTTTGDAVAKPAVNLPLGIPVLRGLPALAAPGDYLLTISGVTGPAGVAKVEQHVLLNDLGRVADFHPSARPQTVTAEVRVTSLLDSFDLWSAAGRISAGLMTLTPASFSYLVRGAHLTTPNASDVVLHGINAMNTTSPPRVADMITDYPSDAIARVGIDEQCWDPFFTAAQRAKVCNAFNTAAAIGAPAYRTWMLSIVHAVLGTGRPVILDVINSGRDDPSFSSTDLPDVVAPDQHTLGVYDDLVRSFANNPQVIFETFNEPKVVPAVEYAPDGLTGATLWRDGGRIQIDGITWTAPGVQTIVDRIRAHGAKNLIMVQGTQWGADLTPVMSDPIDGTNLAYSYHAYNPGDTFVSHALDARVAPLFSAPYGYVGFMSEFGSLLQGSDGAQYLRAAIQWAAAHHTGWAAWGWLPQAWDGYGLLTSYKPLTLNAKGRTVVNAL